MPKKKLITILVPVFNEEDSLNALFAELNPVLEGLSNSYDFEILFTDNHSTDGTYPQLIDLAQSDARIRVIRFSRNFGYQKSILTGYLKAKGDAAIQVDCDLQDPPELIKDFLRLWEEGNEVVYGIRETRQEGPVINAVRKLFYYLINLLSEVELPHHAGDFRLVDRKILDLLAEVTDRNPYLRGTIASFGFRQTGVPYDRQKRLFGKSKIPLMQYFQIAMDGIVSQSVIPLRLATHTAIATSVLMLIGIGVLLVGNFFFGTTWPKGFATTTLLILFGITLNALFLGIIGEYLARLYRQSVPTPLTIVESEFSKKD